MHELCSEEASRRAPSLPPFQNARTGWWKAEEAEPAGWARSRAQRPAPSPELSAAAPRTARSRWPRQGRGAAPTRYLRLASPTFTRWTTTARKRNQNANRIFYRRNRPRFPSESRTTRSPHRRTRRPSSAQAPQRSGSPAGRRAEPPPGRAALGWAAVQADLPEAAGAGSSPPPLAAAPWFHAPRARRIGPGAGLAANQGAGGRRRARAAPPRPAGSRSRLTAHAQPGKRGAWRNALLRRAGRECVWGGGRAGNTGMPPSGVSPSTAYLRTVARRVLWGKVTRVFCLVSWFYSTWSPSSGSFRKEALRREHSRLCLTALHATTSPRASSPLLHSVV